MIEWNVLNIEETTDEEVITAAYRKMLTVTNPETNPGGFMLLRNTYEQALAYARSAGSNSMMNSQQSVMSNVGIPPLINTNEEMAKAMNDKVDLDKTVVIDNISEIVRKSINKGSGIPFASKSTIDSANLNNKDSNINGFNYDIPLMQSVNPTHSSEHEQSNEQIYAQEQVYTSSKFQNNNLQEPENIDDINSWIQKVESIYYNFATRISEDEWMNILANPMCTSLDYRESTRDALLKFLMKHYYLPQKI